MDILYTTYARIRGALGLSEKELPDTQIWEAGVEDQLQVRLDEVYPGHATLFATTSANGGTGGTAEEQATMRLLRIYTQYEAACCLLPQLQMIVVKRISDGDAENTRFGQDNLEPFATNIQAKRDQYLRLLNPDWFDSAAPALAGVAVPGYDPVTDEGDA